MWGRKRKKTFVGAGLLGLTLGVLMVGCDQITSVTPSVFLPPLAWCTPIPANCVYPITADITNAIIDGYGHGYPVTGDTSPVTISGTPVTMNNFNSMNGLGTAGPDNAFSFTLCNIRHITISTCGGATWDTVLYLRKGDCAQNESNGRPFAFSDDDCGMRSEISMLLEPGLYHVILDGYPGSAPYGPYTLYITTP